MIIKERTVAKMLVAAGLYHMGEFSVEAAEDMVAHYYQAFKAFGAQRTNTRVFYASFHTMQITHGHYDMELWERVQNILPNTDDIIFKEVPRSRIAYTWVGDMLYAQEEHYLRMFNYLKERGHILAGWPRETYLMNSTSSTGYIIEIQLPFIPRVRV